MPIANRQSWYWVSLIVVLAAIASGVAAYWSHSQRSLTVARGGRMPPGFADDRSCAECHSEIAATYARSGMGRAWRRWSDAEPIEDRSAESETRRAGPLQYQALFRDGRHVQRESRPAEDGSDYETLTREAAYVLGSGIEGRAYVASENGYLTILPLGWYSNAGRWDLNPNYDARNLRFSRRVQAGCITCHNSMVAYHAGSSNRYVEPLPDGLGCQRCHGPAAHHVAEQRGGRLTRRNSGEASSLVNPARLAVDRQQDVCLQCHLLGSQSLAQPGFGERDFRPGMRLADVRSDFLDESADAQFRAVGHGPRSMASACYEKSGGRMTCTVCHDPHRPASAAPPNFYNERCLDCHRNQSCSRSLAAGEAAGRGDCVACHMPKRGVSDIPHAAATEHWIRRPNSDADSADAAEKTRELSLRPFWPDTSDGQRGAALVEYFGAQAELAAVERGVKLLESAAAATPGVASWQERLGLGYLYLGRTEQALAAVDAAVRADPASAEARHLRGEALVRLGRKAEAITWLEATLEQWPWSYQSDLTLARLYIDAGRPQRLVEMEERYFRQHPADATRLELVARALERLGRPNGEVEAAIDRAIAADGAVAGPHLFRAERAIRRGDTEAVEHAVRRALAADPESTSTQIAWAGFLAATGRRDEAAAMLDAVLLRDPNHEGARRMLRGIGR
jgi:predicted Zn-dependent protease